MKHHRPSQRDSKKALDYLFKGRSYIENHKKELGDDFLYKYIFNRNGIALADYQGGSLRKAYDNCNNGQWSLFVNYGTKHFMHRSVLIFNSVITATALGKLSEAKIFSDFLLTIDSNYPDY